MKLSFFPEIYHPFIKDIISIAKKNKIKIVSKNTEFVYSGENDSVPSAGYFSSDPLELVISLKASIENTMSLLIHESCHMDQYLNNRVTWEKSLTSYSIFYNWIAGDNTYDEHEIQTAADDAIDLELDCERRSVEKIKKYNLPLDIATYKRRANAYLYAISYFSTTRKYHPKIYAKADVWTKAPINFKKNYQKIPVKLLKSYQNYNDTI